MSRVYCSLVDVKRLLRSVITRESKIRFSEAYRGLKADPSNTGTILLGDISFSDAFAEHETYTFEFTDSTSFTVTGDVVGYMGSGIKTVEFELSERFAIEASFWEGFAEVGDKVYLTSASDISNDDGREFIIDSTKRINAYLSKIYGTLDSVAFYDDISVPIPDGIEFACVRYAAFDIFNAVYAGMSEAGREMVPMWKETANATLDAFVSGHGSGPRWKSRISLITTLGVERVGEGLIEINNLPDATNKTYER